MKRTMPFHAILFFTGLCFAFIGCNRSEPPSPPSPAAQPEAPAEQQATPSERKEAVAAPHDLQESVDALIHAVETLDIAKVLEGYADDFTSGTGRSKDGVREVFTNLQKSHVSIKVESAEIEETDADKAKLKTRVRLRYMDTFRDLGEGEVLVTDTLRHSLRKEGNQWKIYADERIATYREGRFGEQSPNAQLEVPEKLPTEANYTVTVAVQREEGKNYQVLVGNYPEDPAFLPPPDIVTMLPENGILTANLLRNPPGHNEMVRITVITEDPEGKWLGATTISKFISGVGKGSTEEQEVI